jgi:hypothetical protein
VDSAYIMKLYHYRDNKDPVIAIEWQNRVEEDYDILDEADEDAEDFEISSLVVRKVKIKRIPEGPKLPCPWELRGKHCDEYWQKVYDADWRSGENRTQTCRENILPDWERAIVEYNDEDSQYWDYRWDYRNVDIEGIPRWKTASDETSVIRMETSLEIGCLQVRQSLQARS